jgi:hypothetical protein
LRIWCCVVCMIGYSFCTGKSHALTQDVTTERLMVYAE